MNATLDSPLIEIPRDPMLSAPKKSAPQGLRSTPFLHCASRVTDCGSLSLQHASADEVAQVHRLVQALLSGENASVRLLAFTGAPENGQSRSVALHTAECLARQQGYRVCVIDADISSNDTFHSRWSIENSRSVETRISPSAQSQSVGELWLLDRGQAAALVAPPAGSQSPREQLLELHSSFDYTILCAPATQSSKSAPIVNDLEGIVLVVEAGKVRRQALESATRILTAGNARLLGTVLTGRVLPIPERLFRWLRL